MDQEDGLRLSESRELPQRDLLPSRWPRSLPRDARIHPLESLKRLLAFFGLLFPAGAETTRSALGGALLAFVQNPEQLARLKSDSGLMRSSIEEIVRWTTPSIYKRRTAVIDTEIAGQPIRRGDKVTFWEMSANRDESAWDRPFDFDIGRWPNKHLGFGVGVHFCLGASLARMEIQVVLEALAERFDGFELAGEYSWMPNNRLLGLTRLEVRAHPAQGG